jgi:hypothetical protein
MNKRIKELEKQCWSHYIDGVLVDGHLHFDVNKFAELIIAECAQACINMGNEYEIKSAGQYQAELFAFAIKKHFGVEE